MSDNGHNWPEGAPDPHIYFYEVFPIDTDEDKAAARFQAKHGQPPEWIEEWKGKWLYVGPVPQSRKVEVEALA